MGNEQRLPSPIQPRRPLEPSERRENTWAKETMADTFDMTVRVRYAETDRMGLLHHANYFVFFEMGRTEMLRQKGVSYREIEDAGHYLVIVDIGCKFKRPAYYDDLLTIRTKVERVTHVKIIHGYQILRDELVLAEGHSTLACVDRDGRPQALPENLI
jgi:acyl-CoA thioester hydrolase